MSKSKIPHPWWHFFFTRWISTRSFDLYTHYYETHYCEKCNLGYELQFNMYRQCTNVLVIDGDKK